MPSLVSHKCGFEEDNFSFSVLTVSFGLGLDLDSNLFGLGLDSDSNLFGLGLVLDSTKVDLTTALHLAHHLQNTTLGSVRCSGETDKVSNIFKKYYKK